MLQRLRDWARTVRRDVVAVWLVARDPRVPWYVKLLAFAVAGYAVSPIDLIPDFVPILGYLDDAIIVPLGIVLVMKLIPEDIVEEHRASAVRAADLPGSKTAALVIICVWLVAMTAITRFAYWYFRQ
jgi:uncharacterized membrane protein YkvA (DUF1232 family)